MTFVLKNWKLMVVAVVILIIVWQVLSGWAQARKYANMLLDNLREDQSKVIEDQNKWIEECEAQILGLQEKYSQAEAAKLAERKQKETALAELVISKGEVDALRKKLENIIVSSDPDKLLEDLRSRGINIRRANVPR